LKVALNTKAGALNPSPSFPPQTGFLNTADGKF